MDDALFIKMWGDREPAKDVCRVFGISDTTRRRIRDRLGLAKRPLGGVSKNYTTNYPHTRESAYLMGVALGDGDISKLPRTLRLRLYCDSKYPNLVEKWRKTCESVFGNRSVISSHQSAKCKIVSVYSNRLKEFPWEPRTGKKCDQDVSIPQWIKDEGFMRECVLGLFESDGCEYMHRNKGEKRGYRMFMFANASMGLIDDVVGFLKDNGVGYSLYIRKNCDGVISGKVIKSKRKNVNIRVSDGFGKFTELMGLKGSLKS